jgi:curved DNA-binding protein CbpA
LDAEYDYYSVLGIRRSASQDEVKRAYRKAVFRYHPDRNPGDNEAAGKFKQVLDAYEVLSDSLRRANYDQVARPAQGEGRAESKAESKAEEEPVEEASSQFGSDPGNGFHFTQDFKHKVEPEPKCPSCSVVGTDRIISRKAGSSAARGKQFILAPFNIIFCSACGHVYGVTASSN